MPPRPLTIVGLGDSTTAGTPGFRSPLEAPPRGDGNPESQYEYWMTRSHPEWTVLNRGINGETSEEIRNRLPRDVLQVRPAYAIILAGVNDIFGGADTGDRRASPRRDVFGRPRRRHRARRSYRPPIQHGYGSRVRGHSQPQCVDREPDEGPRDPVLRYPRRRRGSRGYEPLAGNPGWSPSGRRRVSGHG